MRPSLPLAGPGGRVTGVSDMAESRYDPWQVKLYVCIDVDLYNYKQIACFGSALRNGSDMYLRVGVVKRVRGRRIQPMARCKEAPLRSTQAFVWRSAV